MYKSTNFFIHALIIASFSLFVISCSEKSQNTKPVEVGRSSLNPLIENPYEYVGVFHNKVCNFLLDKGYNVNPFPNFRQIIINAIDSTNIIDSIPDIDINYYNLNKTNIQEMWFKDHNVLITDSTINYNDYCNLSFLQSSPEISEQDIYYTKRIMIAVNHCYNNWKNDINEQFRVLKDSLIVIENEILYNCDSNSWLPLVAISVAKHSRNLWEQQYLPQGFVSKANTHDKLLRPSAESVAIVGADIAGAIQGAYWGYQVMKYGGPKAALIGIAVIGTANAIRCSAAVAGVIGVLKAIWDVITNY